MISSRHSLLALVASAVATVVTTAACSDYSDPDPIDGSGGAASTGGAATTGGAASSGGSSNSAGGTSGVGGTDGTSAGGSGAGGASSGGAGTEGSGGQGAGGASSGGANGAGGANSAGGSDGAGGGGGNTPDGPCDVLQAAGHECVAAYSTIRRLLSTYSGPLYQLRVGSSEYNIGGERVTNPAQATMPKNGTSVPYQTTAEVGTLIDVPQTAAGFGDSSIVTTNCPIGTTCTVAKIYDQSGKGNDLTVAKAGRNDGGDYAALDDFETVMNSKAELTVGGNAVHSLYMEARQGYRLTSPGNDVPTGTEAEGMYLLADGTHAGAACCWDFGNVTPDPKAYAEMNTLFLGEAYWGNGSGQPPWFGADFEAGVWMGGSQPSDPGWGGLDNPNPTGNPNMPSMNGVKYALGFLKTNDNAPDYTYALGTANIATDDTVNRAYEGPYPKDHPPGHLGAIVIGVGGDNSNNSWGTFYEGAVYKGYPEDATELAVMQNIKAAGYGQ